MAEESGKGASKVSATSAIITSFNTWELAAESIRELLTYSRRSLEEILVVDDASDHDLPDDDTWRDEKLRIIRNPVNLGYVASVNAGVRQVQSDILLILDSDATVLGDVITQARIEFSKDPRLGAIGLETVGQDGRATGSSAPVPTAFGFIIGQKLEQMWDRHRVHRAMGMLPELYFSCALLVRREAFLEVGGFDESFDFLDADLDFSYRLMQAGWSQLRGESLARVRHEGSGSPQVVGRRVERFHKNRLRFLEKHGLVKRRWVVCALLVLRHVLELVLLLPFALVRPTARRRSSIQTRFRLLVLALTQYS